jgi:hypothetical protein
VDGTVYYDIDRDAAARKYIMEERNRLVQKMLGEKKSGGPMQSAQPSFQVLLGCGDHEHHDGLITVEVDDTDGNVNN